MIRMGSNYLFCAFFLVLLSKWVHTRTLVLRKCEGSHSIEQNKNEITISNIFMSTNETTTFGTTHAELKCESGLDEMKSSTEYPLLIRPSGYVSILSSEISGKFYSTNQYCIHEVSENELKIQTCKRICLETQPCINKCCPPDKIYNGLTKNDDDEWCIDPGKVKYAPRIYMTYFEEIKGEISPWYSWHPPHIWLSNCHNDAYHVYAFGKAVANAFGDDRRRFRIQADGEKIIWDSYTRHWVLGESTENYCVDGIFYKPDQIYQNKEEESFMLTCRRTDEPEIEDKFDVSFYYGILYISMSWFALITVVVYALLWEKQNIHGWTIMSYCIAVFCWFILNGFAHLTSKDFEQTIFCTLAATMTHFFVIATFCWLALISLDLWITFGSLSMPTGGGIKKFIYYSVFGWGIPLILICFSWSMELMYSADDESEVNIPRYGVKICYISKHALGLYVYLPFGILMLANMILFSMTTWKLIQTRRNVRFATQNLKNYSQSYSLFFKLFIVTGILWVFDIISWLIHKNEAKWYWAIFDSMNGISPFCIFVIFICKQDMIKALNAKYPCLRCLLAPILSMFDQNTRRDSLFTAVTFFTRTTRLDSTTTTTRKPRAESISHPT